MNIKSILLAVAALAIGMQIKAQTTFQIPNASFEQWDGGYTSEPTHWNTFSSSDGRYSSMASSDHHYRRRGGRPGTNGNYYLTIYTRSILGIKANGNMTTGRVHAGAMSATSEDNYNYTQRDNPDHCLPFTATPDSLYVWVSFYANDASSVAHVEAIIHGNSNFKAPNETAQRSLYCAKAVASTRRTTTSSSRMQWQQVKVPFVYDGTSDPQYLLVNITTNETPGGGSSGDSLSIDDIELIYNAWASGITVADRPVNGFEKNKFDYEMNVQQLSEITLDDVQISTEVSDVSIEKSLSVINDTAVRVDITVTGEDEQTEKHYSVTLIEGSAQEPVAIHSASENTFAFYPNPAHRRITVEACGQVKISSLDGHLYYSTYVDGRTEIDVSSFPRGVYIFSLNDNQLSKLILE